MKTIWFYVSTSWATGGVCINEKLIIVDTCPIWRRFVGQDWMNLYRWLESKSKTKVVVKELE